MPLTPVEARIVGCFLEKERTTPETYPLSLNALAAACNQTSNREPVLTLGERELEEAIENLRFQKMASVVFGAGSRVQKYRHTLHEIYNLMPQEWALLCVLLLRGPQTPGELRARADRLASFPQLSEVEGALGGLEKAGLTQLLPPRPGQKERRYVELLSGEPSPEQMTGGAVSREERAPAGPSRLDTLEQGLVEVRTQYAALAEEFARFKRQFE